MQEKSNKFGQALIHDYFPNIFRKNIFHNPELIVTTKLLTISYPISLDLSSLSLTNERCLFRFKIFRIVVYHNNKLSTPCYCLPFWSTLLLYCLRFYWRVLVSSNRCSLFIIVSRSICNQTIYAFTIFPLSFLFNNMSTR